jgi:DNA-binding MarR family transcriptional regulator
MLKQEAGNYYIDNMAIMINDLDNNNKIKDEYNKNKSPLIPKDLKCDINLISMRAWNINKKYTENMELSPLLKFISQDFKKDYISRHFHQMLIWCHGLSKIDIEYLCFKKNGNYVSKSTLLQYLILLQIEKNGKISLRKIADNINCKINFVLEDILGLIFNPSFNPQHKKDKGILLGNFDDNTKIFKEDDEVWLNNIFNSAKLIFNTMPLKIKKSEKEIKDEEKLDEIITRKYQDNIIQATTTRIMKGLNGKQVQHSWLINEISNQIILFNAQPPQIKDNIEKLIEKNIIKREEKDKSYYEYIA